MNSILPASFSSVRSRRVRIAGFQVTDALFGVFSSARHAHDQALCSVTLEGRWQEILGARSLASVPGCTLLKPAGEPHRDRAERSGARVLLIEVDTIEADRVHHCGGLWIRPAQLHDPTVSALGWRLAHELRRRDTASQLMVEGMVLELLGTAARASSVSRERRVPPWLEEAREYVHARFREPVRIADIACVVDVHPIRLARAFPTYFGVALGDYVRHLRLGWVAEQLATTERPIADIAADAGYADQSHLTRVFKRHWNSTPREYRLATKNGRGARGTGFAAPS